MSSTTALASPKGIISAKELLFAMRKRPELKMMFISAPPFSTNLAESPIPGHIYHRRWRGKHELNKSTPASSTASSDAILCRSRVSISVLSAERGSFWDGKIVLAWQTWGEKAVFLKSYNVMHFLRPHTFVAGASVWLRVTVTPMLWACHRASHPSFIGILHLSTPFTSGYSSSRLFEP